MKYLGRRYLRSYNLWEAQNEKVFLELLESLEKLFHEFLKFFHLGLYFLNWLLKKSIVCGYLCLKALFVKAELYKHSSAEKQPEVVEIHNQSWFMN